MPSTTSSVVSIVLDSSTVMTPSLPTFFMASAMMLPTCLSVLALMVPTCAIMSPFTSRESLLISPTATSTALSMPRLRAIGLAPAATVRTPSLKIASASTVAVVVPSPATSEVLDATSRTICAPMLRYGSSSSISLATVTPSLVTVGEPHFLSSTTLRPRGPRVTLTALARTSTPSRMACRACSLKSNCLAAMLPPYGEFESPPRRRDLLGLGENPENVVLAQNHVFGALDLDVGPAVLADQHAIALLHLDGDALAVLGHAAGAHRHHLALLRLLLGGVGNDDAAALRLQFLDAANQDAVGERPDVHRSEEHTSELQSP